MKISVEGSFVKASSYSSVKCPLNKITKINSIKNYH